MSLYVRVQCSFYTHRKTAKLRARLGDDAFWIPPRIWAYAAEHQPDGDFSKFEAGELAMLIGYTKDACSMLEALQQAEFFDGMLIHGWHEHNGYHSVFAERAKKAAEVRWSAEKERSKERERQERKGKEASIASSIDSSNASSIPNSVNGKTKHTQSATEILSVLNRLTGTDFRPVESNLSLIRARMAEHKATPEEVTEMLKRQVLLWKGTDMEEYLRPETLFGKTKFAGYFGARSRKTINKQSERDKP